MTDEDIHLPQVPKTRSDDPEDVAWALSTAEAMWARGEHAEGLKWIRKAAESAADAEDDMRALDLAKAASELANAIARRSVASTPSLEASPAPPRVEASAPSSSQKRPAPPKPAFPSPSRVGMPAASAHQTLASTPRPAATTTATAPRAPAGPASAKPPAVQPTTQGALPLSRGAGQARPALSHFDRDSEATMVGQVSRYIEQAHAQQRRTEEDEDDDWSVVSPDDTVDGRRLSARIATPIPPSDDPTGGGERVASFGTPGSMRPPMHSGRHDPEIRTSQAVRVVVWRDSNGVHVAPAGTVVSAITVDAVLVALEPNADLTAWLSIRQR